MNRTDVQDWLDRYVSAWRTNNADDVAELFTEDAVYSYRPWDSDRHTIRGRDAVVASWLEEPDEPGSWDARYEAWAVEGDRAVAVGWSRYLPSGAKAEQLYHNAYLLEFAANGRCRSFHEFYMLEEEPA
jgi:ketosteroid isomerase-like protein